MRKVLYVAVAVATLMFGAGAGLLWFYFVPVTVSLCDLAHHRDWYDKRIVRVAAAASGVGDSVLIGDSGCNPNDSLAFITLAKGYVPKPEIQAFLQTPVTEPEPQIRTANIVVIGRFDKHASMGCFNPELGIRASNVELKSEVLIEPLERREEMRRSIAPSVPPNKALQLTAR